MRVGIIKHNLKDEAEYALGTSDCGREVKRKEATGDKEINMNKER